MSDTGDFAGDDWEKSAPEDRESEGPFDDSEANPVRPYIDLGGVKILPRDGLQLRLEVEEETGRVVAVGLDYAGSTLQVQPFAAPRSTGLWHEIRAQIADQIQSAAHDRSIPAMGHVDATHATVYTTNKSGVKQEENWVKTDGSWKLDKTTAMN